MGTAGAPTWLGRCGLSVSMQSAQKSGQCWAMLSVLADTATTVYLPAFLRGLLSPDGAEDSVCCPPGMAAAQDVW